MNKMESNNITSREYWENYYVKQYTEENIVEICSKYDRFWNILINSNQLKPKNIIEIGGFPGRYLAYISSKYNLFPICLDYNENIELSKYCFEVMNIDDFKLINADFQEYKTEELYDIVFSHGFIEHFNDFDSVLDKHVQFLKKGGTMMITVPNKRNFRYYYGLLLDYENLKQHNVECMEKSVFEKFVKRNKLELITFEYFGGFPFSVHQELNFFQKLIYKPLSKFFKLINPILQKYPNKYTCSLLICIVKKNE